VTAYLSDREPGESFATWVARADEVHLRGEGPLKLGQLDPPATLDLRKTLEAV
jgi:hypothetical protein